MGWKVAFCAILLYFSCSVSEFLILAHALLAFCQLWLLPLCLVFILRCHIAILSLSSAVPLHLARWVVFIHTSCICMYCLRGCNVGVIWPYHCRILYAFWKGVLAILQPYIAWVISYQVMVPYCAGLRILVILVITLNVSNFGLTFSSCFFILLWIFRYWLGLLWYCRSCLQSCCLHSHGEPCVIIIIITCPRWIHLYNRVEKHSQFSKLRIGRVYASGRCRTHKQGRGEEIYLLTKRA